MRSKSRLSFILIMVAGLLALTMAPAIADGTVEVDMSRIPLVFIENQGQKGAEVLYHADAAGHSIYFTRDAVVCAEGGTGSDPGSTVQITVVGQDTGVLVQGQDLLPGTANFIIGNDHSKWVSSVPTYGSVRYGSILPGVDIVYYGTQGVLKRDIILAPGSDPARVVFRYSGQDSISLGEDGALLVETPSGLLVETAPVCYQVIDGRDVPVACRYVILGESLVGFSTGAFDPGYSLVIDPFLDFSTYLGGAWEDMGYAVAVDPAGSTYVTGGTRSTDFPIPASMPAPYQEVNNGNEDVFVTKFEPQGTVLNYTTYIGGKNDDCGQGIAVNASGYAFVTGYTISENYPVTAGAFQPVKSPGCSMCTDADAFITVLDPYGTGAILSSFLGGNMTDIGLAIALNGSGDPVLTGYTGSRDFPNVSAVDPVLNGTTDAFVTGISVNGGSSSIGFSTFLGGKNEDQGYGIAIRNSTGNIYVTGMTRSSDFPNLTAYRAVLGGSQDAFITQYSPDGSSMVSSTFLGGLGQEAGQGIAVDDGGYVYITGYTQSEEFPVLHPYQANKNGLQDAFLTRFNPLMNTLNFSTYFGGTSTDTGMGIAVDDLGYPYITGYTDSINFPTTANALYKNLNHYTYDAFVTRFYPNGTALMFSTYLGGELADYGRGIAVLGGNATVTGWTESAHFPVKNAVQPDFHLVSDVFVARIASIPPVANFTGEANNVTNYTLIKGLAPLLVNFTDLSTGEPNSWSWLFGDTGTSSIQHPSHIFNTGCWTVNLTVSNAEGSNSTGKYWYVQVGPPLIVNFSAANLSGVNCTYCQGPAPFFVNFTDLTNDTPIAWNWSFGDGNFSTDQHTNWTYNIPGYYKVGLSATNDYGTNSTTKYPAGYLVEAGCAPTANFTANQTLGIAPFPVGFTDLSFAVPAVNMWNWSFSNGTATSWFNTTAASLRNATHVFTSAGNYTVNLTVTNLYGEDTSSQFELIRVGERPVANFTAEPVIGVEDLLVNFTDWSTGNPALWVWNFGDGNVAAWDSANRSLDGIINHTYMNAGNYTPALTVSNEFGSNTLQWRREPPYYQYINVQGVAKVANLTFVPSSATIPTNSTTAMRLVLDYADRGLSGYNITIYFTNMTAANMVSLEFPSWVNTAYAQKSTVPSPSVWLYVFDADDAIKSGATDIELARFNNTGVTPMSTTLNVTVNDMDTDTGDVLYTNVYPAPVTIVPLLPLPGQANPPTDYPFYDGMYWDVNGDGQISLADVFLYFHYLNWIRANEPISLFDYNQNGRVDLADLFLLFEKVPDY